MEIQKIQTTMIGEVEYEEIQETQLRTLIMMKENDAYHLQKIQTSMIGEAEYEEIQDKQLSTLIEVKENDACQQHIARASIREPLHTDDVVVYEEVREGRNQGVRFMIIENKAYGYHLQRSMRRSRFADSLIYGYHTHCKLQ